MPLLDHCIELLLSKAFVQLCSCMYKLVQQTELCFMFVFQTYQCPSNQKLAFSKVH